MRKRSSLVGGGTVFALLSTIWGFYSFGTDIAELPNNAGTLARMLADPPIYLPWLALAASVVFLAFVLRSTEETETGITVDLGLDRIRDDIIKLKGAIDELPTKTDLDGLRDDLTAQIEQLEKKIDTEVGLRERLGSETAKFASATIHADSLSDLEGPMVEACEHVCNGIYMTDEGDKLHAWMRDYQRLKGMQDSLFEIAGGDQYLNEALLVLTQVTSDDKEAFKTEKLSSDYSDAIAHVMLLSSRIEPFFTGTIRHLRKQAERAALRLNES